MHTIGATVQHSTCGHTCVCASVSTFVRMYTSYENGSTDHLQFVIEVLLHEFLPQVKGDIADVLVHLCLHLKEEKDSRHCVQPANVVLFS